LRIRKEKKKDHNFIKILQREKAGRGYKYLVAFKNDLPKWVNRSHIPKRFSTVVEQFDKDFKDVDSLTNEDTDYLYEDDDEVLKDVLGLSGTVNK